MARKARSGQFLMVRASSQPFPLLRRPFSIHAVDKKIGTLEIFFARTGVGTALLAEKRVGETLDIIGPLGKGFLIPCPPAANKEELSGPDLAGKQVFLVGGGRGIAPLYFLAEELRCLKAIPIVFYGGKTKDDLPLIKKFKAAKFDLLVSTEDGSSGAPGLISALVEAELSRLAGLPLPEEQSTDDSEKRGAEAPSVQEKGFDPRGFPAHVFACGPEPMMAKIAALASSYGLPARFSLESTMGCGIGACWGCVRKIKRGARTQWVKVCEEGPVFEAAEIIWDEKAE